MNFKDTLCKNWRAKLLGGGIVALLGVGCVGLNFTQGLEHFSYDFPFALRGEIQPKEALIVYMDEESRGRLKQPVQGAWDRKLHVRLMNELFALGAKAVVFDVLFDLPWPDKTVDEEFAKALKGHRGQVVLGASVQKSGGNGEPEVWHLIPPVQPLESAAPWGVAELMPDSDGTLRQHRYDKRYPSLALETATLFGIAKTDQPRYINYYGPKGAIYNLSYYRMLDSTPSASEMISNRVVFIGKKPMIDNQGSGGSDVYKTAYTHWTGEHSPGVEVQATIFLNLARGDWLERLPLPVELGLMAAAALALGFLLPSLSPVKAFALGAGAALLATAAGIILPLQFHQWFCWAIIPLVEVPAALVWFSIGVLQQRTEEKPSMKHLEAEDESLPANGPPRIPEHEVIRPLDRGAYGQVWLARSAMGKYRAVKIVARSEFKSDAPFQRELRGIQAFEPIARSHEGFVHILQIGVRPKAGHFYYIMELADDLHAGQDINPEKYVPKTLTAEMRRVGRLPCERCALIGLALAEALAKLHEAELIHRDIKPANIIFVADRPKLADIGLVSAIANAKSLVGTEGYMPPEGPGTTQADIYSLGIVLYEMAMGRDRFSYPELPTALADDPQLEGLQALNEIILKACHSKPRRRYATAEKMQADLRRLAHRLKTAGKAP